MLIALAIGFALLMTYGKIRGFGFAELFKVAAAGVTSVKNIAIVMLLVGALTALWRATGTIAFIVSLASGALTPELFLPASFLLCAAISILTGTSVGTAATMGVICMTVGNAIGIDGAICGGAIMSGAYFGDRCSPVSTSALLVAEVTGTNLYDNIRGMIRTGWIPTVIALAVYSILGFFADAQSAAANVSEIFGKYFDLHWYMALPAISILVLALFRINVKINMLISIAISIAIYFIGGGTIDTGDINSQVAGIAGFANILKIMFFGFDAPEEIAAMLSGGGMLSMMKLILVVIISLTYAGLFKLLGILEKMNLVITRLAQKVSSFGCVTLTAIATCALACNQTLSIVLTNDICQGIMPNEKERAIALENTSVIIAPLVPWTVASLVPLGAINAPTTSILFAFFLILTPAIQWIASKKNIK